MDITYIVYLDNILIFSDNLVEYKRHIREVLEQLKKANLYANLAKC